MTENTVAQFEWEWQANQLVVELQNSGITAQVLSVPREYSSIISGIGQPMFGVTVDVSEKDRALKIYHNMVSSLQTQEPLDTIQPNLFRKVVMYSFIGVILIPVLFNVLATFKYQAMVKQDITPGKKLFATGILIVCWIIAFVEVGFFVLTAIR